MELTAGLRCPSEVFDAFSYALKYGFYVELTFYSKKDDVYKTRICAPLDYAPSTIYKDRTPRFHFWDLEHYHNLAVLPENIRSIKILNEET